MRIVHEDDDFLIVDKPVGLVSADPAARPVTTRSDATLFGILKEYVRYVPAHRAKGRPAHTPRLWVIHRLDKEASGLIVFAKSERAFNFLKEELRSKRVHRLYFAVTEGVVGPPGHTGTKQSFMGDGYSADAKTKGAKSARGVDTKLAVTHYRVVASGNDRSLLQVRLETGRKNQIRIHFNELGFPLVGDRRFGAKTNPLDRLGLHAAELGFSHPGTGQALRFTSPAPRSFYDCVGAENPTQNTPSRREGAGGRADSVNTPVAADTAWEDVAGWYDQLLEGRGNDHYQQVILPGTLKLLQPRPGMRVLDVACGQGILCRKLAELGLKVTGIDASPALVRAAEKRGGEGGSDIKYLVGDARKLGDALAEGEKFDSALCIMALSNIEPLEPVLDGIAAALAPGGTLVAVITHPAFRAAGQTSWDWDEKTKTQYRRVDGYLSPGQKEIQMHPGKAARGEKTATTWTFHRPIQTYVAALAKAGFAVDALEEWPSLRESTSGPRAAEENRARREIPLFLGLRALKR